jgi:hypothetical protein
LNLMAKATMLRLLGDGRPRTSAELAAHDGMRGFKLNVHNVASIMRILERGGFVTRLPPVKYKALAEWTLDVRR